MPHTPSLHTHAFTKHTPFLLHPFTPRAHLHCTHSATPLLYTLLYCTLLISSCLSPSVPTPPGGTAGERLVGPDPLHGGGLHQWAAGHGGEHPAGDGLHQQGLVRPPLRGQGCVFGGGKMKEEEGRRRRMRCCS